MVQKFLFVSLILLGSHCREPFTPDFTTGQNDYLVVEGFIHVGEKAVTTITLSRVAPLLSTTQVVEIGASLAIENEGGVVYPLAEKGSGNYQSDSLDLDPSSEYRLLIVTKNNKQYQSAYTKPKVTPPIDSVHWQIENDGVQIYVSAHDSENTTRYYRWEYDETWEINSDYKSRYSYSNGVFTGRTVAEMNELFRCWQFATTADLKFASTTQFEVDQVLYPLTFFGRYEDRTSVKYSIQVEQRAVTQEEYDFLQLVQKNSTVTGSLFDPLPGEIRGNLVSVENADESVIGYVGVYTTQTKRIFITDEQFGFIPFDKCEKIDTYKDQFDYYFGTNGFYLPVEGFLIFDNPDSSRYTGAQKNCMDCRLRGTPIKPDYWE